MRKEPYGLPEGFEWETVDVHDDQQVRVVCVYMCFVCLT